MILDEMVVISLEALEESHDSNVRFCLLANRRCLIELPPKICVVRLN